MIIAAMYISQVETNLFSDRQPFATIPKALGKVLPAERNGLVQSSCRWFCQLY